MAGIEQVTAVLSKPVTPSALYYTITEIINQSDHSRLFTSACTARPTQRLAAVRIPPVDDRDINIVLIWRYVNENKQDFYRRLSMADVCQ